jgi:uncharacterized membrane protein
VARADNPAADNIRAIVDLERRPLAEARWSDRISDAISAFAGSLWVVICQIALSRIRQGQRAYG